MKTGRPRLDRGPILDRLEPYLRDGIGFETACPAAGVGAATVRDWIRTDSRARDLVAEWREEGRAVQHDRCLTAILKAATGREDWTTLNDDGEDFRGDWRAAAWYLERVHPDRFGRVGAYAVKSRVRTRGAVSPDERVVARPCLVRNSGGLCARGL
jgi:hypothetical protein